MHHCELLEGGQAQIGTEVYQECVNQGTISDGHDLMHGADLILPELVL